MVKRCVLGGCTNTNQSDVSVHTFPADPHLKKKWDNFVSLTRSDWRGGRSGLSVICGAHFVAPDDFVGFVQWRAGFRRKLDLVKGAVPSILPPGLFNPTRTRGRQKPRWPTHLNATMANNRGGGSSSNSAAHTDDYTHVTVSSLTTQQQQEIQQLIDSSAGQSSSVISSIIIIHFCFCIPRIPYTNLQFLHPSSSVNDFPS